MIREGGRDAEAAFLDADRIVFPSRSTAALYREFGNVDRQLALHYGITDPTLETSTNPPFEPDPGALHYRARRLARGAKGRGRPAGRAPPATRRPGAADPGATSSADLSSSTTSRGSASQSRGLEVELTGAVPREVALAAIREADLLVCTSRDESGPLVVMEALALANAGGHDSGGCRRRDPWPGVDGEVVPIDDAAALARTIERLAADPDLRARMAAAGRETYERRLTVERYAR